MADTGLVNAGSWDFYDDTDGLGHEPFCLLQHSKGPLYIGTAEGLSRYNGRRFESFSRAQGLEGHVLSMCEDASGHVWLGTSQGLVWFDGRTFQTYRALPELRRFVVRAVLANPDGTILCGTDVSGTFVFDGRTFRRFGSNEAPGGVRIRALLRDREGRTWIGSDLGVEQHGGPRSALYTSRDGIGSGFVLAVQQDEAGRIWCGTEYGGVSRIGPDGIVTYGLADGLPDTSVQALLPYEGGMLCATSSSLCRHDGRGFRRFGPQPGPAGTSVTAMATDREGGLWVANSHAGIARYSGDRLMTLSDEGALETLLQDRCGTLWWGGNGVLWRRTAQGENQQIALPAGKVNAILEDSRGRFWVGTSSALLLNAGGTVAGLDPRAYVPVEWPKPFTDPPCVWAIHEDRGGGDIWIGTSGGAFRYSSGRISKMLDHRMISVLFQDRSGVLWVAGWSGGELIGWDGRRWIAFPGADSLPSDHITTILQDPQGRFWFGLSTGLSVISSGTVRTYTAADGLAGDFVQRLMLDRRGRLWVAHLGGGISVFDGRDFQTISRRDGLPSNGVTGLIEQEDGGVVIATYKGIHRYVSNPVPPLVRIDSVDADRVYAAPEELTLSTAVPVIHIRFSGISFTTRQLRYRYILEGRDRDWQTGRSEEVRYEGLAEGRYTFRVTAISRDLVHSQQPARLVLNVVRDPKDSRLDELTRAVQEQTATLKAERELMDRVMHAMTDAILVVSEAGIIENVNAAGRLLLGYGEHELTGQHVDRVLVECRRGSFTALLGQGLVRNADATYLAKDGTSIPVRLSSIVVSSGGGRSLLCVARAAPSGAEAEADAPAAAHLSDALARLDRAEEAMVQNERLRALGEMASGVAHDFNNALVPVLGYADMLIRDPEILQDSAATLDMLKEIRRAAGDATQVVQNLRSFYAAAVKEPHACVSLNELAKEAIGLTRPRWREEMSAKGASIRVETDLGGNPTIQGNDAQLRTVLTNLIFNSVEAMPQGGVITISTREGRAYHTLEVRDTGVGMTEAVRKRCFDPFFTTRGRHGSGLGLSTVHGIVRRHGGSIEVASQPGQGTLMRIHLPAASAASASEPPAPSPSAAPVAHLRILAVDDEQPCLDVLKRYLHREGHSVELALGGKEALEKFRAGQFDVVLTDRAMPDMSGDVVAAEIRKISPRTPVVMLTGFGTVLTQKKDCPEGVDCILSKPFTLEDLRRVLGSLDRES